MIETCDRVAAGAKLLDRVVPGWAERVDFDSLDMSDGMNCILGQLFGENVKTPPGHYGYNVGTRILADADPDFGAINYGFDLRTFSATDSEWEDLRWAWVDEVEARR